MDAYRARSKKFKRRVQQQARDRCKFSGFATEESAFFFSPRLGLPGGVQQHTSGPMLILNGNTRSGFATKESAVFFLLF